jgi:hypothetical protein
VNPVLALLQVSAFKYLERYVCRVVLRGYANVKFAMLESDKHHIRIAAFEEPTISTRRISCARATVVGSKSTDGY